jgi:hypothetical protein
LKCHAFHCPAPKGQRGNQEKEEQAGHGRMILFATVEGLTYIKIMSATPGVICRAAWQPVPCQCAP